MIAGFLDVLLRGVAMAALCAAAGGVAHVLWTLRPVADRAPLSGAALRRSLSLITIGAATVAVARALLIALVHPWALADEAGRWPVVAFLATDFGRAGLVSIALAAALAVWAARLCGRPEARPAAWALLAALALALCGSGAWLAHAASRLDGRGPLMLATLLHQLGAILWVGGLVHLVGFLGLCRRAGADDALGAAVLMRFSAIALPALGLLLAPGLALSWGYVGDVAGLVGTGYGVMVLTKVILLAGALILGGLNFLLARRPRRIGVIGPLLEAEVGVGITILLAAASLTSLPPAVDVVEDRARPAEVAARFVPAMPRVASPPVGQLLAVAGPIDDTLATRQPEEFAWSEYNHHVAGFFVLAMGILSVLERAGLGWARHWPLGFLGLAAFLFVRNDPRAWPLGPAGFWESMLLPDVLQHRLVVLLVVGLAVFEWLVRAGRLRAAGWRLVFPLLCAVGGALLLTHSHAMFNLKSEFLAEVSHAPMGILAVFMGWGRWIELRLPSVPDAATGGGLTRLPGWLSSVALVMIGAILLVYRES
jgi:putative copper resistance protein D